MIVNHNTVSKSPDTAHTYTESELVKIKHELKDSKDTITESWLASRPLTNELEKTVIKPCNC